MGATIAFEWWVHDDAEKRDSYSSSNGFKLFFFSKGFLRKKRLLSYFLAVILFLTEYTVLIFAIGKKWFVDFRGRDFGWADFGSGE